MQGFDSKTYVILGDGELQEGQIWEAAMSASKFKSTNLIAIVDFNKVAQDNITKDLKDIEPLAAKWESFGWDVHRIDGHNMNEIMKVLQLSAHAEKPRIIHGRYHKRKGCKFYGRTNRLAWCGAF